ncbi:hypothetical protein GGI42DRAFT_309616 [Trichoderma sp. SZMC 28013]
MHPRVMLQYHFLFVFIRLVSPSRIPSSEAVFQSFAPLPAPCTKYRGLRVPGKRDLCSACPSPWATTSPSTCTSAKYIHSNSGLRAGTNKKCPDGLMCQQPEVAHRIPSGTETRWKEKTAHGKKGKHCAAGWQGSVNCRRKASDRSPAAR